MPAWPSTRLLAAWVAACIVQPVLHALPVLLLDRWEPAHRLAAWAALASAAHLLPLLLQWQVLRRWWPHLGWWGWFALACVNGLVAVVLRGVAWPWSTDTSLLAALGLSGPALLVLLAQAALVAPLAAWLFVRHAGPAGRRLLAAPFLASVAVQGVTGLATLAVPGAQALAIADDGALAAWLLVQAALGATWGACSAAVALAVLPQAAPAPVRLVRHPGSWSITLPAVALACAWLLAPDGLRALWPAARAAWEANDRVETWTGPPYLRFARELPAGTVLGFPPDGATVLAATPQGLRAFDLASGIAGPPLGEAAQGGGASAPAWSDDGRWMAQTAPGMPMEVPNGNAQPRQRVRLHGPDGALLADRSYDEAACLAAGDAPVFEAGGEALWVLCRSAIPGSRASHQTMALRLSVPGLALLEARRYGPHALLGDAAGLQRDGTRVVAWQQNGARDRFVFHDLPSRRTLATLPATSEPTLLGQLSLQSVSVDDGQVRLRACGDRAQVADAAAGLGEQRRFLGYCRTVAFALDGGRLLARRDEEGRETRDGARVADEARGWQYVAVGHGYERRGRLQVRELASGRVLQEVRTVRLDQLAISPDGRWLLAQPGRGLPLRVYRIQGP